MRIDVDGRDVTAAFLVRSDGRFYGLITGLADGANLVTAHVPNGPGAKLTIIDRATHGLNLERADDFNAAVLEFLRSEQPSPA